VGKEPECFAAEFAERLSLCDVFVVVHVPVPRLPQSSYVARGLGLRLLGQGIHLLGTSARTS
jgi:hypothetical protein